MFQKGGGGGKNGRGRNRRKLGERTRRRPSNERGKSVKEKKVASDQGNPPRKEKKMNHGHKKKKGFIITNYQHLNQ